MVGTGCRPRTPSGILFVGWPYHRHCLVQSSSLDLNIKGRLSASPTLVFLTLCFCFVVSPLPRVGAPFGAPCVPPSGLPLAPSALPCGSPCGALGVGSGPPLAPPLCPPWRPPGVGISAGIFRFDCDCKLVVFGGSSHYLAKSLRAQLWSFLSRRLVPQKNWTYGQA